MKNDKQQSGAGKEPGAAKKEKKRASYLSQEDVPAYPLDQALRVARAISEQYARKPTIPNSVASAMDMKPSSSTFKMLTGASVAYGLTSGAAQAPLIEITSLGSRIVHPLKEGDDLAAKREALLRPRVIGEFLREYDNNPLPRRDIAINVLVDKDVPKDRAEAVFDIILESARAVGFIKDVKDKHHVDLGGNEISSSEADIELQPVAREEVTEPHVRKDSLKETEPGLLLQGSHRTEQVEKRVFITHGKNKELLEPIKKFIAFGKLEPVVSVERQTVSKPVPDKVMQEMRSCGAAIIHVDKEGIITDSEGKEHDAINPNVLIEIGAAMALFGQRFILLVREGVQLPSNLQGLLEVRYKSETLDADATVRLLEAINDIQNHPVPDRY